MNECICILGNLIYEGYVKGYIFQNEQIRALVLKKDKTFPKLSEVVGWYKSIDKPIIYKLSCSLFLALNLCIF